MESGTLLHLALLRKLSSHSPTHPHLRRPKTIRSQQNRTRQHSPFQPYPSHLDSSSLLAQVKLTRQQNRPKSHPHRLSSVMGRQSLSNGEICGWKAENEQDMDYGQKLKRNQFYLLREEIQDGKRQRLAERKFSFCEAETLPRVTTSRQATNSHLQENRHVIPQKQSQKRFTRRRGQCGKQNLFEDSTAFNYIIRRALSPQPQGTLFTLSRKFPSATLPPP